MRTVEDSSGRRYFLVKESRDSSRVRDPATGEERHVPNDRLSTVEGVSPLEIAAGSVPGAVRRILSAVHDDRALGLLVELHSRGPLSVRTLLSAYDLCESDLHGLLGEFAAAGLIQETDVAGERGYEVTEATARALEALQSAGVGT